MESIQKYREQTKVGQVALLDLAAGAIASAYLGNKVFEKDYIASALLSIPVGVGVHKIMGINTPLTDFYSLNNPHAYHSAVMGALGYVAAYKVTKDDKLADNAGLAMLIASGMYMLHFGHAFPSFKLPDTGTEDENDD